MSRPPSGHEAWKGKAEQLFLSSLFLSQTPMPIEIDFPLRPDILRLITLSLWES